MRCVKCGYVSFDYLSECKKCRTSLTSTRDSLGFLIVKPAVPFLLGSLLSDYESPVKQDSGPVESEISTAFDLADGIGGEFWNAQSQSAPPQAASAIAHPDELHEDFSLLDLSDQELELLIEKGSFPNGTKLEIGTLGAPDDAGMSATGHFSQAQQNEPLTLETEPAVTTLTTGTGYELGDDLTSPDDKPQTAPIPEFIGELSGFKSEVSKSAPAEFGAPPEQAGSKLSEPTDDFVIELSENDLDSLLQELNSTTKGEVEQGGKG